MKNAMHRRIRRLEQGAGQSVGAEVDLKQYDRKHLARVIWYLLHAPRPNDTEARIKGRERLVFKLLDGQEWTDSEIALWTSECDDILPVAYGR